MSNDQITIVCPSCQTYFHIERHSLGPQGRTVRCSVCHKVWFERNHTRAPKIAQEPESNSIKKFIQSGRPMRNIKRNSHPPLEEGHSIYQTFPEDFTYKRRLPLRRIAFKALISLSILCAIGGIGYAAIYYFTNSVSMSYSSPIFRIAKTEWSTYCAPDDGHTVVTINASVANMSDHSAEPPTINTVTHYSDSSGEGMWPSTLKLTGVPLGPGEIRPFTTNLMLGKAVTVKNITCTAKN